MEPLERSRIMVMKMQGFVFWEIVRTGKMTGMMDIQSGDGDGFGCGRGGFKLWTIFTYLFRLLILLVPLCW